MMVVQRFFKRTSQTAYLKRHDRKAMKRIYLLFKKNRLGTYVVVLLALRHRTSISHEGLLIDRYKRVRRDFQWIPSDFAHVMYPVVVRIRRPWYRWIQFACGRASNAHSHRHDRLWKSNNEIWSKWILCVIYFFYSTKRHVLYEWPRNPSPKFFSFDKSSFN